MPQGGGCGGSRQGAEADEDANPAAPSRSQEAEGGGSAVSTRGTRGLTSSRTPEARRQGEWGQGAAPAVGAGAWRAGEGGGSTMPAVGETQRYGMEGYESAGNTSKH